MKKALLIILVSLLVFNSQAHHIIGGEMSYSYLGKGNAPNTSKYLITLKIFRDQNSPPNTAVMPVEVFIGIFNKDNNRQYPGPSFPYYIVPKNSEGPVTVNPFPSCINNAPNLNYHVGIYTLTVELPDNVNGYTASFQTCCRVDNIANVINNNGSETGSTFSTDIAPASFADNSPEFATSIDAICGNKPFTLQFNATDKDSDSLVYSFAGAYNGGIFKDAQNGNPAPPPYSPVTYINGFSVSFPLGAQATIDPKTGYISGTAPDVGKYVLCVKVLSYRNGVLLNDHRKDFILNVTDCDFAGAKLTPRPVICDSFNVAFKNDDESPLNRTFYWEFGDPATGNLDTSTLKSPTHVYSDSGQYIYKLVVNRGDQCSDSTTQILNIYPGFQPAFNTDGECINSPIFFSDRSTIKYGTINEWTWNFGDPATLADTSHLSNPGYTYELPGKYPIQLTITSTKGCKKTIADTISIKAQPDLFVSNDTLMCSIDTLQLTSIGNGTITWTPNYNINNQHSFTPLISPDVPTKYFATLVESRGCIATDSVMVNVVNNASLSLKNDTTICLTDTATLNINSDGLHYVWTPSNSIVDNTAKYPSVFPLGNTRYHVVASIGKCSREGDITVNVIPYPKANAGNDTTICFPESYQLSASGGSIYSWSPAIFLNNSYIPDPISSPQESIRYVVEVKDVLGCPKPTYDSVTIIVEKLVADAGPRDTSIVVNQPLQLNGTGGDFFLWSPPKGLNNPNVSNPVAVLANGQRYILQVTSVAGCTANDTIDINVYKVLPDFYVPDAFTPNGDGLNDIFRPILIGMKSLKFFKVYNRLGQLVFSTNVQKKGWDGTINGNPQDAGVFVWMAEGEDYLGKIIFKKGTVTLIR